MSTPISELPTFTVGFEIEHESPSIQTAASVIPSSFGIIKGDGSVPHGFELESAIFHREDFTTQTNLEEKWDALFAAFAELNVIPVEEAGHHIHIGFNALTPEQLNAVARFIAANKQVTTTISERNYDLTKIRTVNEFATNSGGRAFVHSSTSHGNGSQTAEFRMFQTQGNLHGFLKNMQYVISVCDFIRGGYYPLENCGTEAAVRAYIEFIQLNAETYPHLIEFAQAHNFFSDCFINEENCMTVSKFTTLQVASRFRELIKYLLRISEHKPYVRRADLLASLQNSRAINFSKAPKTVEFVKMVVAEATANNKAYIRVTDPPKVVKPGDIAVQPA